ncbi:ATP-binding protein [Kineococcus sp. SYSU DK006]|uniref:ATP-binding protein n=1 Tax=Kineococcus sp. SYSU DK006 TaxID=3383127 RepID=UPI003D7EE974
MGGQEGPGPLDAHVRLLHLPLLLRARLNRHVEALLREFALIRIGGERGDGASLPTRLLELSVELETTYAPLRAQRAQAMEDALAAGATHFDAEYDTTTASAPYVQHLLDVLEEADAYCRTRHLLTLPAEPGLVAFRRWLFGEIVGQLAGGPARPWRDEDAGEAVAAPGAVAAPPTGAGGPAGEAVGPPLVLDPVADAVAAARRHVRSTLRRMDAEDVEEPAELAVSEVVTNAVLHARTPFAITVRASASGGVRVEVADASPAPVQVRRLGSSATTGRGLQVVASLSTDWGVEPLPAGQGPGKTVWFEPRPDAGAAAGWSVDLEGLL